MSGGTMIELARRKPSLALQRLAVAILQAGEAFERWNFLRGRLRVVSEFEFRQGRVTRASVNKRNRHAKRPNGRR